MKLNVKVIQHNLCLVLSEAKKERTGEVIAGSSYLKRCVIMDFIRCAADEAG